LARDFGEYGEAQGEVMMVEDGRPLVRQGNEVVSEKTRLLSGPRYGD
jgi:hypothetical protein